MINLEQHIEIENYLNGQLSADDLNRFEQKLSSDEAFKAEVEMMTLANEAVISGAKLNIKTQLQVIHEEEKGRGRSELIKSVIIGIVVLIVFFAITAIYNANSSNEADPDSIEDNSIPLTNDDGEQNLNVGFENIDEVNKEKVEELQSILAETLDDKQITNSDSLIESYGTIGDIILNPDKYLEIIKKDNLEDTLTSITTSNNDSTIVADSVMVDPCAFTIESRPNYSFNQAVFGDKLGAITFDAYGSSTVRFKEFSIDGGSTFESERYVEDLNPGDYQLIARDENGCETKSEKIKIAFEEKNYVIQPAQGKNWEIEIRDYVEYPMKLEIRNARTGALVFQEEIEYSQTFNWSGSNQNGKPLSFGNYVYIFSSSEKGIITKGQITIL
jgi:hypothetical protein